MAKHNVVSDPYSTLNAKLDSSCFLASPGLGGARAKDAQGKKEAASGAPCALHRWGDPLNGF